MTKTIVALYDDVSTARRAVEALVNRGIRRDDISFTVGDENNQYSSYLAGEGGTDTGSAVAGGAGVGAVLGGLGGLLVGLGALAIPGVGPIIAAGPLASALVGAGVGAVAGGLVGGLIDIGVPEDEAELYAEGVRRGNILVAVAVPETHVTEVTNTLQSFGPIDVRRSGGWSTGSQRTGTQTEGMRTTGRSETGFSGGTGFAEGMRSEERGSSTVPGEYSGTGRGFGEMDIEDEGMGAGDFDRTRTSGTSYSGSEFTGGSASIGSQRSESWTSDQPRTTGTTSATSRAGYDDYDSAFRRHYMDTYGDRGRGYDYYASAYSYGYTLGTDPRYTDRDWRDVEMEARRGWESTNDSPWDDVADAIRNGWERVKAGVRDATDDTRRTY